MQSKSEIPEAQYRLWVQAALDRIEKSFEQVDPDIAECEQSMGALSIMIHGHGKCILSGQPSVRQLWLALASQGIAYHFDFDLQRQVWVDDRGQGVELMSFLQKFLDETVKVRVSLK